MTKHSTKKKRTGTNHYIKKRGEERKEVSLIPEVNKTLAVMAKEFCNTSPKEFMEAVLTKLAEHENPGLVWGLLTAPKSKPHE